MLSKVSEQIVFNWVHEPGYISLKPVRKLFFSCVKRAHKVTVANKYLIWMIMNGCIINLIRQSLLQPTTKEQNTGIEFAMLILSA